jgi:hypothetical protein
MKQGIFLFILSLLTINVYGKMKYGFTAGAQLSAVKFANVNTDTRLGFNTGFSGLAPVSEGVDFHIQFVLSGKGYTYFDSYGHKSVFRPLYLQLPVVFRFNFNSSTNTKIFFGGGGYYAFGIAGNQTYYPNGYKESIKIKYGTSADDDLKSSEAGLSFQFGVDFRENYEGHFFYDMGLTNILPNTTSNSYNRVFGFNLTWYFKGSE